MDAQLYRNLTTEKGLKNNNVYSIARDKDGFMWFLNSNGVDRFDGIDFIHFPLKTKNRPIGLTPVFQLVEDHDGYIWQIGTTEGNEICRFNNEKGDFEYTPIENADSDGISFLFLDSDNRIWISSEKNIFVYDIKSKKQTQLEFHLPHKIKCAEYVNPEKFIAGTEHGLFVIEKKNNEWKFYSMNKPLEWKKKELTYDITNVDNINSTNDINAHKMKICNDSSSILVFDNKSRFYMIDLDNEENAVEAYLMKSIYDACVMDIRNLFSNDQRLLIATEGRGVFKLEAKSRKLSNYLLSEYNETLGLKGNITLSVYPDPSKRRIWFANYPYGVCCYNIGYPSFEQYINHNSSNSVSSGVATSLIEDSDGDIWVSTSSAVSLFERKKQKWRQFLREDKYSSLAFLTIGEISPGTVVAGGLMSGLFVIEKESGNVIPIGPKYFGLEDNSDRAFRGFYKDRNGKVWLAGERFLVSIDWAKKIYKRYPLERNSILLAPKDEDNFWLVTLKGLSSVNINTGKKSLYELPPKCVDINDVLTAKNGDLYIATVDEGLFVKRANSTNGPDDFEQFTYANSSLTTNNILSVIEDNDNSIILTTDRGITKFYPYAGTFANWQQWNGMMPHAFYKKSKLLTSDNRIFFGTYDGVIEIPDKIEPPRTTESNIIFSRLYIGGKPKSPSLDFDSLNLGFNERQIAFTVSNLNYDNPYAFLYSWRLDGTSETWTTLSTNRQIRYLLNPGKYRLFVRAYSVEDLRLLEERELYISIKQPWWFTSPALLMYLTLFMLVIFLVYLFFKYRNRRVLAEDKVRFFIHAAHEIRTPLTLIKAPLEEISRNETLSERGQEYIKIILNNANNLLMMTGDLLNIERLKIRNPKLKLSKVRIEYYFLELLKPFRIYAKTKNITLDYSSNFEELEVFIDRNRMDSIVQNIINNALKYTPEKGSIKIKGHISKDSWTITVSDTGIGIPQEEQSKLSEMYFRSSNAEKKSEGSGVGLHLAYTLIKEHKGSISFVSEEGKGTTFILEFPINFVSSKIEHLDSEDRDMQIIKDSSTKPVVLFAEDNEDIRRLVKMSLSDEFNIVSAKNGFEAYNMISTINPSIIVSDIMMPEMNGDELCHKVKTTRETSHIPVILLTALADNESIVAGLKKMPDIYLTKPFNVDVLKAQIKNVLENRKALKELYMHSGHGGKFFPEYEPEIQDKESEANDIDIKFMNDVNEIINKHLGDVLFNVDILCREIGMSRTNFYNKLKSLTEYAPADFIRLRRLEYSRHLLSTTHLSISEVSDRSGFSDPKYFREVFKKYYGKSPSNYRDEETNK